ncbi:hypothetical protein SUGI_1116170 [Cryptomeria japonica]|nr:hypothetical protein SUGI_1116170 [Cryptomeria japonica]
MKETANAQQRATEEEVEDVKDLKRAICEECRENPFKYKCPGCGLRSCSLPCVKAHKLRTRCTGKRNRTQYVPLSQFDENWLVSDYNLLEEILRMTEAAKRTRAGADDSRSARFMRGGKSRLNIQAKNRNINLLLQPKGMLKNKINRSYYDKFRKCICWTVEWQFHSTDVTYIDHRMDEHASLQSILEKHLTIGPGNPVIRHKLRHFCNNPIESLKLLLKKEYMEGDRKVYFDLNIMEPLRSQLAWKTIIEYPVILVVLPSNLIEFELSEDTNPVPREVLNPSKVDELENLAYQECAPFKEEEIEEKEFEPSEGLCPVPEKILKGSNIDEPALHLEGTLLRDGEIMEGEFGFIKDMKPVLEKTVEPLNVHELDDRVHLEGFPIREEETEQGENVFLENLISVPEKNLRPSNFDELDDLVHLDDLAFRDEEIEEGEFVPHQHFDGKLSFADGYGCCYG